MPNVLLKNEIGEDVEYENVDTVTLRKVDGGTATYTYGLPEPTENWHAGIIFFVAFIVVSP